jgi:enoyl-CoA hydratase/carnithine racemase
VRRGIVPEGCSSFFLPRMVGMETAIEWCMSGRTFPAQEALDKRLVRAVVAPDDLLPAAKAIAREIAVNAAPVSVALTRLMMWRMLGASHPMEAHRAESRALAHRFGSGDAREGVMSWMEKRAPAYPDKVSTALPDIWPGYATPKF